MFARKLRIEVAIGGNRQPCPMDWLDRFLMRNFTGAAEFDDTLPVADGRVDGQTVKVEVTEERPLFCVVADMANK